MKKIAYTLAAVSIALLASSPDVQGRGGRGGGRGGGGSRGGGGYSRPAPSRSPSMSRPTSRPSHSTRSSGSRPSTSRPGTRPSTGTRPSKGSRPGTGTRPSTGGRPSQSQLNSFLNIPSPSSGRPGTGRSTRPSGGGAANDFLQNRSPGQRPNTDRTGNRTNRTDTRGDRQSQRAENGLRGNRPERIENRGQLQDQRSGRRDEVRNQFQDHHPRYDFWKDNPNWARFRFNRPYRAATWGLLGGWFPGVWSQPASYGYGENIYYEDDTVYYGDEAVASADEYAQQAQTLATSAPEVDESSEWLPLGVFALTQDGEKSGPPPTLFVQLAVNKQGVIAGTFQNTGDEKSQAVEGMINQKNQRAAWTIVDKKWPIMETGISSLTKDTAPALIHFEDGQTQQWLLVRLEEPKEGEQGTPSS